MSTLTLLTYIIQLNIYLVSTYTCIVNEASTVLEKSTFQDFPHLDSVENL